jgi:hypothetical protein
MLASYVPTFIFVRDCYAPNAEFDRAFPAFAFGLVSVVLTIAYIGAVFWNHRFF